MTTPMNQPPYRLPQASPILSARSIVDSSPSLLTAPHSPTSKNPPPPNSPTSVFLQLDPLDSLNPLSETPQTTYFFANEEILLENQRILQQKLDALRKFAKESEQRIREAEVSARTLEMGLDFGESSTLTQPPSRSLTNSFSPSPEVEVEARGSPEIIPPAPVLPVYLGPMTQSRTRALALASGAVVQDTEAEARPMNKREAGAGPAGDYPRSGSAGVRKRRGRVEGKAPGKAAKKTNKKAGKKIRKKAGKR